MQIAIERPSVEERILDDVEARLLTQGYRAMRVDALARDVGISKRTLYEHFRSKQEMARCAIERRYDRLADAIERTRASQLDVLAQLREVATMIAASEAELDSVLSRELEATPWLAEELDVGRSLVHGLLDAVLDEGRRAGRLRARLDTRLARRALLATLDAACQPAALVEDGREAELAARQALDLILAGLAL